MNTQDLNTLVGGMLAVGVVAGMMKAAGGQSAPPPQATVDIVNRAHLKWWEPPKLYIETEPKWRPSRSTSVWRYTIMIVYYKTSRRIVLYENKPNWELKKIAYRSFDDKFKCDEAYKNLIRVIRETEAEYKKATRIK